MIENMLKSKSEYIEKPEHLGGPSHFGINKRVLNEFTDTPASNDDVLALTEQEARVIYQTVFKNKPGIEHLPELLQPLLFDMSMCYGPKVAVKLLQLELNDLGYTHKTVDGQLSPETKEAAQWAVDELGNVFLLKLVARRINRYRSIAKFRPSIAGQLKEWISHALSFLPKGGKYQ